jgi:phosphoketolase
VSDEVLQPFLKGNIFRAYIINKYYDFSDVENHLKTYVDDTLFEEADLYLTKRRNIFIRENRVTEYNSIWPWASPKEYKFYSVSKVTNVVVNAVEEESNILTQFEISMDNQIDIYERRVYTLLDIFSDLGGIYEIIKIFGSL